MTRPRQLPPARAVVHVELRPGNGWSVHVPDTDIQGTAHTVGQLADVLRHCVTEADIAAYSARHGYAYDGGPLGITPYQRHQPIARGPRRCDVYHPTMWRLCTDGTWLSPRGHRYGEDTWQVQRVMDARVREGLSARPGPTVAMTTAVAHEPRAPESTPPDAPPTGADGTEGRPPPSGATRCPPQSEPAPGLSLTPTGGTTP